ncbi:MAG: lytic transglycosylase domain-containing protein [Anaeromyxobacteraceae bacterium]
MIGAMVAAGAFAVALLAPAHAGEGPRPLAPAERGPSACPARGCDPAPAGFLADLEREVASRMPALDAATRRALARTVLAESRRAAIDPLLVLALIEVESSFEPDARSNRGAQGLMQLREETMRAERERSGLPPADPADPIANVQSGVRYLRRLLDSFEREDVALMAYNAGPNRILGYLREGGVPDRFHAYPRKVRSELRRLRRTLGPPPPAFAAAGGADAAQAR